MKRRWRDGYGYALSVIGIVSAFVARGYFSVSSQITAIIVASILFTVICGKAASRKKFWTKKRKVNYGVLALWIAVFLITISVPQSAYGNFIFHISAGDSNAIYTWKVTGSPAVSYRANWTATTDGLFSVLNPVKFTLTIYDVNLSNFLSYYPYVYFINGTAQASQGENPWPLTASSDGKSFSVSSQVNFDASGETWFYPYHPDVNGVLYLNKTALLQLHNQTFFLNIGTQSDTLTTEYNQFTVSLGFALGSFSILLLQPLIEGIIVKDKTDS